MPNHVEWLKASETHVFYGEPDPEVDTDEGFREGVPVMVLSGSDVVAIDGTAEELRALARRMLRALA